MGNDGMVSPPPPPSKVEAEISRLSHRSKRRNEQSLQSEIDGGKEQRAEINLFCPSLSKLATIVAWDDQRLDLGTIASTFGLHPATLKLNSHFISRGVNLVASSVTWKSLLSFFSARGLSTGAAGSPALLIHGTLCKFCAKRARDPAALANSSVHGGIVVAANPESTPKKLKLKDNPTSDIEQVWVSDNFESSYFNVFLYEN